MNTARTLQPLRFSLMVFSLGLVWGTGVATPQVQAQTVVRVEEDWELVVATTDENSTAPQISCTISPVAHTDLMYATFELNHHSQPSFAAGGMQLQTWLYEQPYSSHKWPQGAVLATPGETVTWTQTMTLAENKVVFEVVQGNSTTWGTFGGTGQFTAAVQLNLANLNGYSPDVSVQNSGVGFAANRVHSLTLKRVRLITSSGEVVEDSTPRVVHSQN